MSDRPATMNDVARESGVSIATVSYVVNNGPRNVDPVTKARVVAAMGRLRYHPNSIARALTQKRLNSIGVVFPRPHPHLVKDSYFSAILDGIIHVAVKWHQHVMLYTGLEWHGTDSLPAFRDKRVDGFVVIAAMTDSTLVPSLKEVGIPFVQINGSGTGAQDPNVDIDNISAVRKAVEHLAALGHRRIAYLGGEPNGASTRLRREGFKLAISELGLKLDPALMMERSYDKEWGYDGMNQLLALSNPPTAVFAGGDGIAVGAYRACAQHDISVPEMMSVIGFDDAPYASFVNPPLTTLRQPLTQMGAAATSMLMDQLDGKIGASDSINDLVLPVELIVRESTAQVCKSNVSSKPPLRANVESNGWSLESLAFETAYDSGV